MMILIPPDVQLDKICQAAECWSLDPLQPANRVVLIRYSSNHLIINILRTTSKTNTVKSWSLNFQRTNIYFGFCLHDFHCHQHELFDWSNWFLCQTRFIIWILSVFLEFIPMQCNIPEIDKYVQIGQNLSRRKTAVLEKQKTWSQRENETWWSVMNAGKLEEPIFFSGFRRVPSLWTVNYTPEPPLWTKHTPRINTTK